MVREHTVGERYDGGIASPARGEAFATTTAIDPATGKIKWQIKTEVRCSRRRSAAEHWRPRATSSSTATRKVISTPSTRPPAKDSGARGLGRSSMGAVHAGDVQCGRQQYVAITTLPGLVTFALP